MSLNKYAKLAIASQFAMMSSVAVADTAVLVVHEKGGGKTSEVISDVSTKACEELGRGASDFLHMSQNDSWQPQSTVMCISDDGESIKSYACHAGECTLTTPQ